MRIVLAEDADRALRALPVALQQAEQLQARAEQLMQINREVLADARTAVDQAATGLRKAEQLSAEVQALTQAARDLAAQIQRRRPPPPCLSASP